MPHVKPPPPKDLPANLHGTLKTLLLERFGLKSFREGQLDVITSVLSGHDAMAVMPTGGGKSLCYQMPALARPGIVIVISPLIALMRNQVQAMQALGIPAGCLYSGQDQEEKVRTFATMKDSPQYLLYLSPERVQKPGFAAWLKTQNISLFAIDESHCVSQWGPDFRKDYFRLELLRELRPTAPILALTATATPPVLKDIEEKLSLRNPDKHIHGFYRPNLYYQVEQCDNDGEKYAFLEQALQQTPKGRVLIYCGTRNQTEDVANTFRKEFPGLGYYHAGLSPEQRQKTELDYGVGKIRVLAATNAFGMGIDHPDVRLVVHLQMPANIESLYQEMGRAGRDGTPSTCLLLFSKKDKGLHAYFINKTPLEKKYVAARWRALDTITQFSEGGECRHAGILTYFKDSRRLKACGHCDVCLPASPRKIAEPKPVARLASSLKKPTKSRSKSASKFSDDKPLSSKEQLRADMLKDWRKSYADERDIPAFLVFSNKTLNDLARKNPTTLDQLEGIYGLGDHKIEHLGPEIIKQLEALE